MADAGLAQARAEVAIAGQQLARTQVRAPFTGRIGKRFPDPGSMLAAGVPLFTLVDDSVLEFEAQVPSRDYAKMKIGAPVQLAIDALPGVDDRGPDRAPPAARRHALALVRRRRPGAGPPRPRGRALRARRGARRDRQGGARRAAGRARPRRHGSHEGGDLRRAPGQGREAHDHGGRRDAGRHPGDERPRRRRRRRARPADLARRRRAGRRRRTAAPRPRSRPRTRGRSCSSAISPSSTRSSRP